MHTDGRWVHPWVRACAIYAMRELTDPAARAAVRARMTDESPLVRETAVRVAAEMESRKPEAGRGLTEAFRQLVGRSSSEAETEEPHMLTIEKVMLLRSLSVFENVPDDVLSNLAELAEETFWEAGQTGYEKGGMERTMYVIVSGRVRMHDEERTFVSLGEREFFGEPTTLDPEPHSASASAKEDTHLLGLDRDALYEVMSEHPEILRGFIHVLCERLRGKRRR